MKTKLATLILTICFLCFPFKSVFASNCLEDYAVQRNESLENIEMASALFIKGDIDKTLYVISFDEQEAARERARVSCPLLEREKNLRLKCEREFKDREYVARVILSKARAFYVREEIDQELYQDVIHLNNMDLLYKREECNQIKLKK